MFDRRTLLIGLLLLGLIWPEVAVAQGLIIPGAGAANRAMAGASTAAPLDAAGAGYWNPAAISGLPGNQVYFGADLIYGDTDVAVDPLPPPGSNFSESGLAAAPTIAMVYHRENSRMTVGLGMYALVGGAINFPTPQSNPPLTTVSNQYSAASGLLLAPTVSMQITERLAVGLGPTVNIFALSLDPAFFAQNLDGSFPSATHGRPFWGGGFRAGLYYELNPCWSFGAAYLSPQWFETFEWNALDENGAPKKITLGHRLPSVLSGGVAYRGIPCTVLAADVRYIDYANSRPYGEPISAGGTAWDSIFAVALGVERRMNDRMKLRAGYLYNENPIPAVATLFNTQLPAVTQHQLSLGLSMQMTQAIVLDFAWVHAFENTSSGPVPIEQLPAGTTVELSQSLDSWVFGLGVNF